MIEKIINEIKLSLKNQLYISALTLVLTLPDICGKAEYPNEKTKIRYIKWYNDNIGQYEKPPVPSNKQCDLPYLSGEVVYQLRNSVLHQGTPNIDIDNIKEPRNKIDTFILEVEPSNEFDIYCDLSSYCDNLKGKEYILNLQRLCLIICNVAESYYLENKDKFNFFKYTIIEC